MIPFTSPLRHRPLRTSAPRNPISGWCWTKHRPLGPSIRCGCQPSTFPQGDDDDHLDLRCKLGQSTVSSLCYVQADRVRFLRAL